MAVSNPSVGAAAMQQPSPDIQQVIALLGSLMPLLVRFQSQAMAPTLGPTAAPTLGPSLHPSLGSFVAPDPAVDQQAAVNLISDITADSLRTLSSYLEAHAARNAGLEQCVPVVTQAAHSFAARDFAQAFNLIFQAYRIITMIRAADPQLPPVRESGPSGASTSTTSVH
jgi:hypothetical protein